MATLIHIPHASLAVPDSFYKALVMPKPLFRKYNLEMTDVGIDELIQDMTEDITGEVTVVKAQYSRLYCDVERYRDDTKEVMAKYGEGVLYTHTYDGARLRENPAEEYRREVFAYYDQYHAHLDSVATELLNKSGELLILDCHSFSDKMASAFFSPPFPDVCIGVNPGMENNERVQNMIAAIREKGLSHAINHPYSGSIIPNALNVAGKREKVCSIMVEVNKRVYL